MDAACHAGATAAGPALTAPKGVVARIYGNLARLLGGKVGAGALSLLYMLIAVRVLGPRDYGVLIVMHTFAMTIGGLIEFPGWHAVVRYGAQAVEAADEARLIKLLRFASLVEALGGVCAVATAAILGPWLGPRLGWSPTAVSFALPYSLATLASIRATPAGYLQLCGRFDLLGLHVVISPLVRLIGATVIALTGGGLRAFLEWWLAAALIECAAMWLMGAAVFRRRAPGARFWGALGGVRRENAGIWRFMIGANADATFSDLASRMAPLVIGWIGGPVNAGLYAVAQRATVVISQPAQLLGQAAYAELARLVSAGGGGRAIWTTLTRSVFVTLAICAPALVAFAVAPHPIARLLGGKAFERAGDVILLLGLARTVLLLAPSASAALVALGRPGLSVCANLVASLGLLPLLPVAMTIWGLPGAGAHAILQAVVGVTLLVVWMWRVSRSTGPSGRLAH